MEVVNFVAFGGDEQVKAKTDQTESTYQRVHLQTIHILKNNHSKPRLFIQAWPTPVPTPAPTPDICRAFVKCFLPTVGHLLGSARGWGISQTWYLKTSTFIQKLTNQSEVILKRRAPYCKGLWRAFAKEFVLVCKYFHGKVLLFKLTLWKQKQRTFSRLSEFWMVTKISFLGVRPKNRENYYYIRVTELLPQSTPFITDTAETLSQCPHQRESVIVGIYFSQTFVLWFFLGFSCCPFYRGVRYSEVSAKRELTVYK